MLRRPTCDIARPRPSGLTCGGYLLFLTLMAAPTAIFAQGAVADSGVPAQSIATNFPHKGDPDGRRKALALSGITYGLNYVGEWQSNVSGGVSRGDGYIGRLEGVIDVDFSKLAGWHGFTFHTNVYQIHGTRFSRDHLQTLMPASYIEGLATTRLSELWVEQKFFGDLLGIRVGQQASDSEFLTSAYATQFINNTFGWPAITAANLPSGGPAYPFATPAVRAKLDPDKNTSLLLGLFNGDPAGPGPGDPEERNRHGLNFRVQDPALIMGEVQYRYNQDKGAPGLAGTIKLGAWGHFGHFDDQRFDTDGRSLADPTSNGNPRRLRGDHGIYGAIDQQIWRPATGEPDKGVGVFVRLSANPSDRNMIDAYIDGGIVFAGPRAGTAQRRVELRRDVRRRLEQGALDADAVAFSSSRVIRDFEAVFEANYQIQVLPGLEIDLDLQRFVHPGGHIAGASGAAILDATVVTLHTSIKY